MKTKKAQLLASLALSLAVPAALVNLGGCNKKEEPPPPLPSAPPAATTAPAGPVELVQEVVPPPTASASASTAPVRTGGGSAGSLKACCSALTQNAQSAPEPNKTYMLQAAAVCNAAAGAGQASGAILGSISAALRGAGMPPACK
ncbi:MAG TPA: acyltransferase [Polyangiaceae bacterium]|nr:acyltransferase [Polyangiaceae bacterium]